MQDDLTRAVLARDDVARYMRAGGEHVARAEREVVLAAGAIGSPHILLASGIGPAAELSSAGIHVVHDLPGVGKNLQDHLLSGITCEDRLGVVHEITTLNIARWFAMYALGGRGQLRIAPVEAGAFIRFSSDAARPDLQFHFVPWGAPTPNTDIKRDPPAGRGG